MVHAYENPLESRPMDSPSPSIRNLAKRLLSLETAANPGGTTANAHAAARVCEKLRTSVSRFAGADSYAALLRRGLALARDEDPSLSAITINPDCSFEGLDALPAGAGGAHPVALVIAHLLGLLETFIGGSLTLRLVRDAWPDASLDE